MSSRNSEGMSNVHVQDIRNVFRFFTMKAAGASLQGRRESLGSHFLVCLLSHNHPSLAAAEHFVQEQYRICSFPAPTEAESASVYQRKNLLQLQEQLKTIDGYSIPPFNGVISYE